MKILLTKRLGGLLAPGDQQAEEALKKIGQGELMQCEIKRPRNLSFHRKYFALLTLVFQNQEKYEDFEAFRAEVTMRAGWWEEHKHLSGKISFFPKSISFAKMDENDFSKLYDKTIDVLLEHFLPGTPRETLITEVQNFMGNWH